MKKIQTIILLSWLIIGCTSSRSKDTTSTSAKYAQGFSIESKATYDVLILKNTVPNSQTVFRYLLIADGVELPKGDMYDGIIRTPVKRIVVCSTTHIAFLNDVVAALDLNLINPVKFRKYYSKCIFYLLKTVA